MKNNATDRYEASMDIEQVLNNMGSQPDPIFIHDLEQKLLNQFREQQSSKTLFDWFFPKRWGWIILGILIFMVIGLIATPDGRALAKSFIELFQRSESSQRTIIYQADIPAEKSELDQPIEEIELLAGFNILEPANIPTGVYFHGGLYDAERGIAWLDYGAFLLGQQREQDFLDDEFMPPLVGPDTTVETLIADNFFGHYYHGAWISYDNPFQDRIGETGIAELTWDSNIAMETLTWQQQDIVFLLIVPGKDSQLSGKQAMLDLALSLASERDSDQPATEPLGQPATGPLRYFVRAQKDKIIYTFKAFNPATAPAFKEIDTEQILKERIIPLPQYLPHGFEIKRAFYFSETETFTLLYMFGDDQERSFYLHYIPEQNILEYLHQEAQQPTGVIGASAKVEQLQLDNEVLVEWVAGEWSLIKQGVDATSQFQDGDQIEGNWDEEIPSYRLRWEQIGWMISLEHVGSSMWHLNQEELVEICTSLQ